MYDLSAAQRALQQYVLAGDQQVCQLIAPGPRGNPERRLAVYYNAYRQRLVEALSTDFEALAALLGEARFRAACEAYVEATPSHFRNIRWYGSGLSGFLASTPPWRQRPELAEIARFEWTLTLAFDASDAPAAAFDDLAKLPPEAWGVLRIHLHPSLHLVSLRSNAPALRLAVDAGTRLPELRLREDPVDWAVWRKAGTPHFRSLAPEERWAMDAARRGEEFPALCEGLMNFTDSERAPALAASLLRTWVEDELVAGVSACVT
jgi:hypothetical protein